MFIERQLVHLVSISHMYL